MTIKSAKILCLFALIMTSAGFVSAEQFEYNSRGKRDPFVPLVGSEKPTVAKLSDITSVEDMRLEGIAGGAKGEMVAIINGEMIKKDDRIGDIVVRSITKAGVTLTVGGKEYQLKLPEEGGQS